VHSPISHINRSTTYGYTLRTWPSHSGRKRAKKRAGRRLNILICHFTTKHHSKHRGTSFFGNLRQDVHRGNLSFRRAEPNIGRKSLYVPTDFTSCISNEQKPNPEKTEQDPKPEEKNRSRSRNRVRSTSRSKLIQSKTEKDLNPRNVQDPRNQDLAKSEKPTIDPLKTQISYPTTEKVSSQSNRPKERPAGQTRIVKSVRSEL